MQREQIVINTDSIKLDQLLKFSGVAETGGDAKDMIAESMVKLNGDIVNMRGKKIHHGDMVEIEFEDETLVIDVVQEGK